MESDPKYAATSTLSGRRSRPLERSVEQHWHHFKLGGPPLQRGEVDLPNVDLIQAIFSIDIQNGSNWDSVGIRELHFSDSISKLPGDGYFTDTKASHAPVVHWLDKQLIHNLHPLAKGEEEVHQWNFAIEQFPHLLFNVEITGLRGLPRGSG